MENYNTINTQSTDVELAAAAVKAGLLTQAQANDQSEAGRKVVAEMVKKLREALARKFGPSNIGDRTSITIKGVDKRLEHYTEKEDGVEHLIPIFRAVLTFEGTEEVLYTHRFFKTLNRTQGVEPVYADFLQGSFKDELQKVFCGDVDSMVAKGASLVGKTVSIKWSPFKTDEHSDRFVTIDLLS